MKPILLVITTFLVLLTIAGCAGPLPAPSPTGFAATRTAVERPDSGTVQVPLSTAAPVVTLSQTDSPSTPIQGYTVSGTILAGGDTTPDGLQDAPRVFSYSVQTDDGRTITLTYTAFPPSPAGDRKKITLNFHAGEILIGDYVRARGSFDERTRTLVVAEAGDSIETFAHP